MGVLDRAARLGIRHGVRKGLLGGSQVWLAVGVAAVGVKVLQRLSATKPTVVTERLSPGQTIVVRHLLPGEE